VYVACVSLDGKSALGSNCTCFDIQQQNNQRQVVQHDSVTDRRTESPDLARVGRPYRLYPKASVRLLVVERKWFPRVTTVRYKLGWPCYKSNATKVTISPRIRYSNSVHVDDGCRQNFAFKIAAKPLQIKTWLLLTAYKNSLSPYPTVPLPTPYEVQFSHNTWATKRQTYRTQGFI